MQPIYNIPIIVDGIVRSDPADLSRCVYLTITADEPGAGWTLTLQTTTIPFLLLGLQGILYQPGVNQQRFNGPNDIDDMIAAVEAITLPSPLNVETGIIWVPTAWLDLAFVRSPRGENPFKEPHRGDVFRVAAPMFQDLWRHMENRLDLSILLNSYSTQQFGESNVPMLQYSFIETLAFRAWTARHLGGQSGGQSASTPP